ncbi:MAG: hypothetical protein JWN67_5019 [Actinomycetia bacterium]|nr:hypothetical protein [Actinomycetes bacterium]
MAWGQPHHHVGGASVARLHALGTITLRLTLREAAALHSAGLIIRTNTPDGGGPSLTNGLDAIARALEAKGCTLDDIGWHA